MALSHVAASPIAVDVVADVELVSIERRRLHFKVHCHDGFETIGEETHDRVIIERQRFLDRLKSKAADSG